MPASITIISGNATGQYECGSLLTIGRVKPNDIVLPDPKVSRNHATIRVLGDGKHYISDTGSSNGTFLNAKRVVAPCPLENNDVISIGDHEIKYEGDEAAAENQDDVEEMETSTMVTLGHKIMEITILVSDIKNYTPLSEEAPEDLLAAVMGDWCRAAAEAAQKNCGVVDKFIGDAVMIRWLTARSGILETVKAALKTAAELNEITQSINARHPDLPAPLGIGVGINTGRAVLGNVGGSIGRDYTAIGDAVNLAFRIEAATRKLEADIVLGKDSYKHLPEELVKDRKHSINVKGKSGDIDVCALKFSDIVGADL